MSERSGPSAPEVEAADLPAPVMTARLAASVLALEAFCAFFATVTAAVLLRGHGRWSVGQVWLGGVVVMAVLVVLAGLARRPGGVALGWLGQGLLIATGVAVPAMYVVGAVFALLWLWLLRIGTRIDRDRRRWRAEAVARAAGR